MAQPLEGATSRGARQVAIWKLSQDLWVDRGSKSTREERPSRHGHRDAPSWGSGEEGPEDDEDEDRKSPCPARAGLGKHR